MMICPFCSKPNSCHAEGDCWCFFVDIPNELLVKLPKESVGCSCICKNCISRYQQDPEGFIVGLIPST